MNPLSRCRIGLPALGLAVLAGCAQVPSAPETAEAPRVNGDQRVVEAMAKHRRLALELKQAGDLAGAAVQWQIVVLLDPHDEAARRELAATQAAAAQRAQHDYAAGVAALRNGDTDRAAEWMLKVLALDPDNADAAKTLRDIEKRRLAKVQAGRAAKVGAAAAANGQAMAAPRVLAKAPSSESYEFELPLEMLRAGDTAGGLRDLHRYVDANPGDRAARVRIGNVVYERAVEVESNKATKEQALPLFEQAVALRGDAAPGWNAHILALRKSLSEDYFQKGVQAYPGDRAAAIKYWQTSLRYDAANAKSAAKLKDAGAGHGTVTDKNKP